MTEQIETTELEEETVTSQNKNEKLLTQEEVNKILAKERREATKKYSTLEEEYKSFREQIEAQNLKLQEKYKNQVDALKKDLPEQVIKLLDKLPIEEQLEYLEDPENKIVIEKKHIPETPEGREKDSSPKRTLPITRF